jgi:hypothetical protein
MTVEDEFIMKLIFPILCRSICNQYYALRRASRQRQRWCPFKDELTNRQFRCYFQMKKEIFQKLCVRIEECVGAEYFKSKKYLDARLMSPTMQSNYIFHAHHKSTGGMLCGEVKLAVTIWIQGGGLYLDTAMVFKLTFNPANTLFVKVVYKWLCHCSFYLINGIEYVQDEERMTMVATQFVQHS